MAAEDAHQSGRREPTVAPASAPGRPATPRLVLRDRPEGVEVACTCGWLARPFDESVGWLRWREHVLDHVDAHDEPAAASGASARRRIAELTVQAAWARTRRAELARRRSRLTLEMNRRRAALLTSQHRAATAWLDAARVVAGLSLPDLWIDYFGLGGNATMSDLGRILNGERPLYRLDHDRIALALNERFSDMGLGRPVALWDGTH